MKRASAAVAVPDLPDQERDELRWVVSLHRTAVEQSNDVVLGFARQMITVCSGAMATILGIAELGGDDGIGGWVVAAVLGFFVPLSLFVWALTPGLLATSADSPHGNPGRLIALAHRRRRLALGGTAAFAGAVAAAAAALWLG
ncbi:hypothetical protein [Isoptericola aurantiacus]|uniref:hypothetical protein n=1 Tax=Isoptericola aurantiacus TaxID=3377839 RepID=UPI00383A7898